MNNKGFGLVQLIITIVILAVVGIAAYKSYFTAGQQNLKEAEKMYDNTGQAAVGGKPESVHTRKAKELEGRVFINSVITALKVYEAVNGRFLYTDWTSESKELGVNTAGNQYFKEFSVEKSGSGFLVKVRGSGELEGVVLTSE
ncbi:MAG: hypothetical protein FWG57_00455 [Endomicrobia bacterium]|nr:hypothetical protein [Endomicrobiia bacterium]